MYESGLRFVLNVIKSLGLRAAFSSNLQVYFRELRKWEVQLRRIPLPRTSVNKDKKERIGASLKPRFSYVLNLPALLQATWRRILVLSCRALVRGGRIRVTIPVTFVDRGEGRHTPKRHTQRQHQRRDQQRNALPHLFSPPLPSSQRENRLTSLLLR